MLCVTFVVETTAHIPTGTHREVIRTFRDFVDSPPASSSWTKCPLLLPASDPPSDLVPPR